MKKSDDDEMMMMMMMMIKKGRSAAGGWFIVGKGWQAGASHVNGTYPTKFTNSGNFPHNKTIFFITSLLSSFIGRPEALLSNVSPSFSDKSPSGMSWDPGISRAVLVVISTLCPKSCSPVVSNTFSCASASTDQQSSSTSK